MPSSSPRISVVLPVRDGEQHVESRVVQVLESMSDLTWGTIELIVVDDGSQDSTPEVLSELKARYPQVRIVRHSRPRGLEAAGQTGLERSTGELVFIQETDATVRIEDMRRLLRMSEDKSVVAARAESTPRPLSGALMRRLRAFGTHADTSESASESPAAKTSMQMIRRPHLQKLASQRGSHYRLNGETVHSTSLESSLISN